jgi:phage repressor protein C with HTH and peptisase S24 domain
MTDKPEKILKKKREEKGLTQSDMAKKLGISLRMYQRIESGMFPKYKSEHVKEIDKTLNTNLYETIYDTKYDKGAIEDSQLPYQRKPKTETNPELEGVTFVPIAAQANYTQHLTDPVFLTQLEKVYIPGFPYRGPRYRIFEVAGDSMEPTFREGYHVVTEIIEPEFWHTIANYYVYVVVTESQVMLKRLFRKSETEFVLISDNEDYYPQFVLAKEKVREIWLVKRKLDWEMSPPKRFEIKV